MPSMTSSHTYAHIIIEKDLLNPTLMWVGYVNTGKMAVSMNSYNNNNKQTNKKQQLLFIKLDMVRVRLEWLCSLSFKHFFF